MKVFGMWLVMKFLHMTALDAQEIAIALFV